MLLLGAVGCHHKNTTVNYPPPPPPAPASSATGNPRPAPGNAGTSGRGAPGASGAEKASANAQLEPQGKPVSSEIGLASWYGPPYTNRKAADGSIYDQNAMTAAHRELPMGSIVRVTNLTNNQSVYVRITDRGPFVDGRIIDLSLAAAKAVDVYRPGGGVCAARGIGPGGQVVRADRGVPGPGGRGATEERPNAPLCDGQGD
jgi:rare lipoprotein A